MRRAIQGFAAEERCIYAECGGLMYLTSTLIDFEGRSYDMVGVIPAVVKMSRTTMTLGYRSVELTQSSILGEKGTMMRGHEFHYSSLASQEGLPYISELTNAQGNVCGQDGIRSGNVVACYTHIHFMSQPSVTRHLVEAAKSKGEANQ